MTSFSAAVCQKKKVLISGCRPSKKHHPNSREGPPREGEKNENYGERGKKSEILGGPAEGCPVGTPSSSHPLPHILGVYINIVAVFFRGVIGTSPFLPTMSRFCGGGGIAPPPHTVGTCASHFGSSLFSSAPRLECRRRVIQGVVATDFDGPRLGRRSRNCEISGSKWPN